MSASLQARAEHERAHDKPGVLVMVSTLSFGGAEKHAVALVNHLDTERFRLGMCHIKSESTLAAEIDRARLDVVLSLDARKGFDWGAVKRLARAIDLHRIDVVVCTNGFPALYALLASWLARRPVRLVEVLHTTTVGSRKGRLRVLLNRILFRRCELLVYVSFAQRRYWQERRLRAKRDVVIQNGIDTEYFTDRYTPAQKAAARAEFGFAPDDYVIGICAGLRPEKAHGDLLQAVAMLRQQGIRAKLLMIGDGVQRPVIERQIDELQLQGSAAVSGFKADVRPYVAACDVMALTSRETFSMAALESMALGKPMVMTSSGGGAEQVTQDISGLLFAPGDIVTLTRHLAALADPERRQRMGAAAMQVVRERFTTQRMVDEFTSELSQLVPTGAPGDALRVLMVGPALRVQGGVSAVERLLIENLPNDVTVKHVPTMVEGSSWRKLVTFGRALVQVNRELRRAPDIVHIHFASYASSMRKMIVARLALARGAKVVMHAHGGAYREYWQQLSPPVRAGMRDVLRRVDRLIVLGERWRDFFVGVGVSAERIAVLPNPVALPECLPKRLPQAHVRIVYLGLIAQRKGVFDLVEALAAVPREHRRRVRIVIAGKGAVAELLELAERRGVSGNLEVPGWIGPAERDQLLASAHAFVLPSYVEGLPMSLLEAMAWGLMPICTPVGSIPDYVRDGVNGILVQPGNPAQLADAIQAVVVHQAQCMRMGVNARATIEPLAADLYGDKVRTLYRSIPCRGSSRN